MDEYKYFSADGNHTSNYVWTPVKELLKQEAARNANKLLRLIDVGCGNGAFLNELTTTGWSGSVMGVEPSESGVAIANQNYPLLSIKVGSGYDNLASAYGSFDIAISLEVIEHVYSPRQFVKSLYDLLNPGGMIILSTPYHGYLKNLALALSGKLDQHFTALWDHGHIKFWSVRTLSTLLREAGFQELKFLYAGRFSALAKSMIVVAQK